ncbi:Apocarotenoid-15,15'-oxygenase [bacterium HR30]|nr:Apocarotenoid-15,15'-oxygenase [bacterium HR30]
MAEMRVARRNPFLEGNFAPWRDEGDFQNLPVRGRLPAELQGTYYRNGPNPAFDPIGRYHWFDGDGMVHAVRIGAGRAAYSNRWVRSKGLLEEFRAGRALYYGLLELGRSEGGYKNTANTNVLFHASRFFALMEAGLPTELDPVTLVTLREYDFGGRLRGPMTAHPKIDPRSGELLFFGYSPVAPFLTFYRADPKGNLVSTEAIPGRMPAMVHDFAITEHYAVFFVCPLMFRLENMGSERPVFSWEPSQGMLWGVLPRNSGGDQIQWLECEPCFIFHAMNAYERGNTIVVDVVRYPYMELEQLEQRAEELADNAATLWRFTLETKIGRVWGEKHASVSCEFPRIDERMTGQRYRYGFMVARSPNAPATEGLPKFTALAKCDWQTGRTELRDFGPHVGVGEAVFVPRGATVREGDGYLLALIYDELRDTSELHVLSVEGFLDEPLAVVELPHRVPYGFHGAWVPGI